MRERGKTTKNSISETISLSVFLIFYFYNLRFMADYIYIEKRRLHMYEHMFFFYYRPSI